ncbi:metallophosphoesterase 1 isoform X11 [Chanodichthys erythropterus]|uniref:metallophosphoesterase 1 isoform X11 n=1 Tax=Chanodichthys erythropterus TaxID=933992 RepID=UPI00351DD2E8
MRCTASSLSDTPSLATGRALVPWGRTSSPRHSAPSLMGHSEPCECTPLAASISGCSASQVGPQWSTQPPHGYFCCPDGATRTVLGGLATPPQPTLLAHSNSQTQLCEPVRQASPQVQRRPIHLGDRHGCPCPACRNCYVLFLPRHKQFLCFVFEGWAYQYKVPPFGLSFSTCLCQSHRRSPCPAQGGGHSHSHYLDDWLILAQSKDQLCEHRDLVLSHLSRLGLWVNWEKSKLSPVQSISFLGVELDSVNMMAHVTSACSGHTASGSWTGPQRQWHISCLELLAVLLALRRFQPLLHDKHVLVWTDNTLTVAYISHQGGLRFCRMSRVPLFSLVIWHIVLV